MAVSTFCSQALAQQNIVTIQNIAPSSDLQTEFIVATPTTHTQGQSSPAQSLASSFSRPAAGNSGLPRGPRYPADLQYHGGPVVDTAVHHSIFVNPTAACPPNACWGNPIGFLNDLGNSGMIHLVDQYIGDTASNRYTVGTNYLINYPAVPSTPLTNLDAAIIAYSAAVFSGNFGFGHIYHVFLVPGQDLCFDSTFSTCYSPDNLATFFFCGYHTSAHDSAGNRVVYTAEPFQDVDGCSVKPGTPNGQLADSTNSILSHEVFETITDPRGSAWWNSANNGIYGEEIGDECSFLFFTATNVYFNPNFVRLNGNPYAIQPEYSNSQHACTTTLGD